MNSGSRRPLPLRPWASHSPSPILSLPFLFCRIDMRVTTPLSQGCAELSARQPCGNAPPGAWPPVSTHTVTAQTSSNQRDPSERPADHLEIKHIQSDWDTEIILIATFTEHLLCASHCERGGVILIIAWSVSCIPPKLCCRVSSHFPERETEGCRGEPAAWLHGCGAGPRGSNSHCLMPPREGGKEHWTGSGRLECRTWELLAPLPSLCPLELP